MLERQNQSVPSTFFDEDAYDLVLAGKFNPLYFQKFYVPSTAMAALVMRLVTGRMLYDMTTMEGYIRMLDNLKFPLDFDTVTGRSQITEVRNFYEDYRR